MPRAVLHSPPLGWWGPRAPESGVAGARGACRCGIGCQGFHPLEEGEAGRLWEFPSLELSRKRSRVCLRALASGSRPSPNQSHQLLE